MTNLVSVMRSSDYIVDGFSANVAEILEITGKSIKTVFNGLSLLKLPDEIRAAIRVENLPVSQGYLFAANLDCPDHVNAVNEKPSFNMDNIGYIRIKTIELLTRIVILQRFRSGTPSPSCLCDARRRAGILCVYFYAKHEHGTGIAGISQFLFRNLSSVLISFHPCYIKDYLWLDELHVFCALVELRIPIAPEPAPEKKKPPQV